MQVTHENILSHLYKFENLKNGLIKLREKLNDTTVSNIKNEASSIDLSMWEDIISAKVDTKVEDLKTNVIPSIGSSISKDFEEMVGMSSIIVGTTENYAKDKETYENIKKEISNLESSISNQSTDTEEGRSRLSSLNGQLTTEKEKLDKAWETLEKDLNKVNFLLNAIANIRFIPGGSDEGNQGNTNEEPKQQVDEPELVQTVRDRMGDLFQWGIFHTTISYNGHTIYLFPCGRDSDGNELYAFYYDLNQENMVPNMPKFTHDQVTQVNAKYNGEEFEYPEVERAVIEYYSSL